MPSESTIHYPKVMGVDNVFTTLTVPVSNLKLRRLQEESLNGKFVFTYALDRITISDWHNFDTAC